jgi:predicted DNA binding protein
VKLVRFRLVPPGEALHPVDAALARDPEVERRAIHHLQLLGDGTATVLHEVAGDADRVRSILEDAPTVRSAHLTVSDEALHGYVHFEPSEPVEQLLALQQQHGILLETPLEYTPDGALRLSVVGDLDTIRRAVPEVPSGLDLELEQVSDYEPDATSLWGELTDAQQETLRAAVEHGYYADPREVGYRELAEELDRSPATVGEHLRKAEARVLSSVVP